MQAALQAEDPIPEDDAQYSTKSPNADVMLWARSPVFGVKYLRRHPIYCLANGKQAAADATQPGPDESGITQIASRISSGMPAAAFQEHNQPRGKRCG